MCRSLGGDWIVVPLPAEEMERKLALAKQSFKAALEIMYMRAQYFWDITEHGAEEAW